MEEEAATQKFTPEALGAAASSSGIKLVFKRYRLVKEIGKGGMGKVWLARDSQLDQAEVALKFLKSELASDPQSLHDLKQEVLNNRVLAHQNILRAFNLESDETESDPSMRYAISMEYVKGTSLSALKFERSKQNRVFDPEEIQHWVFQLCDAMQHAHEIRDQTGEKRPVIHRDIKPANLLLNSNGDLKVCDFGIGCTVAETMSRLTNQTTPSGTLFYMSPEQVAGKTPSPAQDIYSIGATIYELIAGQPPFFRGTTEALIEQVKNEQPPTMEARRRELGRAGKPIPAVWEKTIAACLAKDPTQRPPSVRAIREMLEGESVSARGAGARPAWLWPVVAIAVIALGTAGYWFGLRPQPEAETAHRPAAALPKSAAPAAANVAARPAEVIAAPRIQAPQLRASIEALVSTGKISRDEAGLLDSALRGEHGEREQDLAARFVDGRLAGADAWRQMSGLLPAPDEYVSRLRPMLHARVIQDSEFLWLYAALTGAKGKAEQALAGQLVLQEAIKPEHWRRQSDITPADKRDPLMEQIKPLLEKDEVRPAEAQWLRDALAGEKGPFEQIIARQAVAEHSLTLKTWRVESEINPPDKRDALIEPVKPFLVSGRLNPVEAQWVRDALGDAQGPEEKTLAAQLVAEKSVTPGQWRAKTAFNYALPDDAKLSAANLPAAIDLPLAPGVSVRLLRMEKGTFLRGTPREELGRRPNELMPEQTAITEPFYLGVHEVTQAQYTAVMPRSPSFWRGNPTWPIDQVDWNSVAGPNGFVARLNRLLAKKYEGVLAADLPTEDEWEYACRAGAETSFNNGRNITSLEHDSALDPLANYNRAETGTPKPVGSFQPNAWGLYDMHGNLSEWCQNRYIRGGSWQSRAANCRAGWRTQISSEASPSNQLGFRLVLRFKPATGG
jgi:hypothetical protein